MRQLNNGSGEAELYLTSYDRWRLAAWLTILRERQHTNAARRKALFPQCPKQKSAAFGAGQFKFTMWWNMKIAFLSNREATAVNLQYCCSPLYPEADDCFPEEVFIKETGQIHLYWTYRIWEKNQLLVSECRQKCKTRWKGLRRPGLWGQRRGSSHNSPSSGDHQIISYCLTEFELLSHPEPAKSSLKIQLTECVNEKADEGLTLHYGKVPGHWERPVCSKYAIFCLH